MAWWQDFGWKNEEAENQQQLARKKRIQERRQEDALKTIQWMLYDKTDGVFPNTDEAISILGVEFFRITLEDFSCKRWTEVGDKFMQIHPNTPRSPEQKDYKSTFVKDTVGSVFERLSLFRIERLGGRKLKRYHLKKVYRLKDKRTLPGITLVKRLTGLGEIEKINYAIDLYDQGVPIEEILLYRDLGVETEVATTEGGENVVGKRENMLDRLIKIKQQNGEITEKAIKDDPLLNYWELLREFKNLNGAKKQVKLRMKKLGMIPEDEPKEAQAVATEVIQEVTSEEPIQEVVSEEPSTEAIQEATTEESSTEAVQEMISEEPIQEMTSEESTVDKLEEKVDQLVKEGEKMKKVKSKSTYEFTLDIVHDRVLKFARKLGKVPTSAEAQAQSKVDPEFPSPMTIRKYLGNGWRDKLQEEFTGNKESKKKVKPQQLSKPKEIVKMDDELDVEPDLSFTDITSAKQFLDGALTGIEIMSQNMPNFESSSLIEVSANGSTCYIYITAVK